jgi:hypothetical protein
VGLQDDPPPPVTPGTEAGQGIPPWFTAAGGTADEYNAAINGTGSACPGGGCASDVGPLDPHQEPLNFDPTEGYNFGRSALQDVGSAFDPNQWDDATQKYFLSGQASTDTIATLAATEVALSGYGLVSELGLLGGGAALGGGAVSGGTFGFGRAVGGFGLAGIGAINTGVGSVAVDNCAFCTAGGLSSPQLTSSTVAAITNEVEGIAPDAGRVFAGVGLGNGQFQYFTNYLSAAKYIASQPVGTRIGVAYLNPGLTVGHAVAARVTSLGVIFQDYQATGLPWYRPWSASNAAEFWIYLF